MGKMKSAGKIQFNIPGILYEVKMSQIFLGMNSRELTSPGNLCNDRFMFELTKENIDIKKNRESSCADTETTEQAYRICHSTQPLYIEKKNEEKYLCTTVYLQQKPIHI